MVNSRFKSFKLKVESVNDKRKITWCILLPNGGIPVQSTIKRRVVQTAILAITLSLCSAAAAKGVRKHKHRAVATASSNVGLASYYADKFHGKLTANGEVFDADDLTAAHRSLQFGTLLQVTNLKNNKSVVVRVNDRGPHVRGRIVDLSNAAAAEIGLGHSGTARVKLEVLSCCS
jgi:rare lipoprotein A